MASSALPKYNVISDFADFALGAWKKNVVQVVPEKMYR